MSFRINNPSSFAPDTSNRLQAVGEARYTVLEGTRTVSKSSLSKIKNLLHTLSQPGRALWRSFCQSRVKASSDSATFANIKSPTPPRATSVHTSADSATRSGGDYELVGIVEGMKRHSLHSPAKTMAEPRPQPGADYVVVEVTEGVGRPSLLGRIWG